MKCNTFSTKKSKWLFHLFLTIVLLLLTGIWVAPTATHAASGQPPIIPTSSPSQSPVSDNGEEMVETAKGPTVYIGSTDSYLYALDANKGAKRWKKKTGDIVNSSPVVANGIVYFGSFDGNIYAVNAKNKALIWKSTIGKINTSSPAVADGLVYIGTESAFFCAIDAKTGKRIWKMDNGIDAIDSSPIVHNGVVYVGDGFGHLYAMNAKDGQLIWTFITGDGRGGSILGKPVIANGIIYFNADDGRLHAVDIKNGTEIWHFSNENISGIDSPAVANGVVYVGTASNVYAFNASTGKLIWKTTSDGFGFAPVVVNNIIYIDSYDKMNALSVKDGSIIWTFTAGGEIKNRPAVFKETLYFGSRDSFVYALDTKTGLERWRFKTEGAIVSSPTVGIV